MTSDALRRLAARFSSIITISGGYSGYSGYSSEKSEFLCTQSARANGYSGYSCDPAVPAVPGSENVLGTDKASKSLDVPGVPAVPAENDKGANAARPAAEPEPPTRPDEWGLSRYTIRDLACWYEEEGNRRRVGLELDQDALDRDLRHRLAELGVFPEFIAVEFERVMQAVFAVGNERWGVLTMSAQRGFALCALTSGDLSTVTFPRKGKHRGPQRTAA